MAAHNLVNMFMNEENKELQQAMIINAIVTKLFALPLQEN